MARMNDRRRMDWLERYPSSTVSFREDKHGNTVRLYCDAGMFYGKTLRQAIERGIRSAERGVNGRKGTQKAQKRKPKMMAYDLRLVRNKKGELNWAD